MSERTNDPEPGFEEIESRLAAYGDVLRGELEDSDKRRVAAPGGLAATAVTELGASTAPTRRERMRTGVLVAAVLALIAGISFIGTRTNDPGTTVEVATEPSSVAPAPAAAGLNGDETGNDDGVASEDLDEDGDIDPGDTAGYFSAYSVALGNFDFGGIAVDATGGDQVDDATTGFASDLQVDVTNDGEPEQDESEAGEPEQDEPEAGEPEQDEPEAGEPEQDEPEQDEAEEPDQDETVELSGSTELVCEEGELMDDECWIIGPPPITSAATCPAGARYFEDLSECYVILALRPAGDPCVGLEMYNDDYCSEVTDFTTDPMACLDGFALRASDGLCTQTTVSESPTATCAPGTLQGEQCVVVEDQLEFPVGVCPDDGLITHTEIDGTCYRLETPSCGDLLEAPNDNSCQQPHPVEPEQVCWDQPNLGVIDGVCAIVIDGSGFCPDGGEYQGDTCVYYQPGTGDPLTCPDLWFVGGLPNGGDGCVREAPVSSTCDPAVSTTCFVLSEPPEDLFRCIGTGLIVFTPGDCWTPVPLSCVFQDCLEPVAEDEFVGFSFCDAQYEWALIDGQCTRYAEPYFHCEVGEYDGNGGCVRGPDHSPFEQDTCIGEGLVEVGPDCHRLILASPSCPETALPDGACGRLVASIAGGRFCDEGYSLVGSECIRWEDPIEVAP